MICSTAFLLKYSKGLGFTFRVGIGCVGEGRAWGLGIDFVFISIRF